MALTGILAILSAIALGYAFEFPFIMDYQAGKLNIPFISSSWLLLLTASFAFYSNIAYILLVVKSKFWLWSGSISHMGFALFLLGILISQGRQETISGECNGHKLWGRF